MGTSRGRGAAALVLVLVLALTALTTRAGAAPGRDDVQAQARTHFERGLTLYRQERYQAALEAFERGYALAPRPRFLVSIGQCHRRLGSLAAARDAFRRFLVAVPADDPDRARVGAMLREVEAALAAEPAPAAEPPPANAAGPVAEPPAPSAAAPAPAPPAPVTPVPVLLDRTPPAAPPQEERPWARRYGWAIAVGVAVVGAVGVGIYFLRQGEGGGCRPEDLSCLDLR